jgi:hypothetical protein
VVCGEVGGEDFCSVVNGDTICDGCLDEKTGAPLGVTESGDKVYELGTLTVDSHGDVSFIEDENEFEAIPVGAIGYRVGSGWVYPVGWVKPKEG